MDLNWFNGLPDDTRRLVMGCVGIIITLSSLIPYQYFERNRERVEYEVKLDKERDQKDSLRVKLSYAQVDCEREKYLALQKSYEEQKALNAKQVEINDKQREENVRQKEINMQNRQTTESTKSTVQQIKAVLTD